MELAVSAVAIIGEAERTGSPDMSSSTAKISERRERRRRMWSGLVLARYWALQLPATVLVIVVLLAIEDRLAWPQWLVWTVIAVWVAKDAILYPFVWRAYDPSDPTALP